MQNGRKELLLAFVEYPAVCWSVAEIPLTGLREASCGKNLHQVIFAAKFSAVNTSCLPREFALRYNLLISYY
jgi:hypothetical protein